MPSSYMPINLLGRNVGDRAELEIMGMSMFVRSTKKNNTAKYPSMTRETPNDRDRGC